MGLSSDILWHQTSIEGLKGIFSPSEDSNKFILKCSYSLETINWKRKEIKLAFPMISLCDLPISDIGEYIGSNPKNPGKYGKYTIGLKRSWGKNNKISPVWYRDAESNVLCDMMEYVVKNIINTENIHSEIDKIIWQILAHTKNHTGSLLKYNLSSYRFYDEREIRYIPSIDVLIAKGISPMLTEAQYEEYKNQHKRSPLIDNVSLPFTLDDIAYILISQPNQLNRVRDLIFNSNKNYNQKIVFLSYKQIWSDIIGLSHLKVE